MIKKRLARVLLPIVAVMGLIGGAAAPAGATTAGIRAPWNGSCGFYVNWEVGSSGTRHQTQASSLESGAGSPCSVYWQAIWLCGLYGVPPTYYYQGTVHVNTVNLIGTSSIYGAAPGAACNVYSNDIILNWWIVVSIGPFGNTCYNRNADTWAGGSNGPGGLCEFS